MTAAAESRTQSLAIPPIAGIPFEYRVFDGIPIISPDTQVWQGTRTLGAPVVVEHRLGDASVHGLRLAMEAPPWSAYYVDPDGAVCTRFHEIVETIPARLLRAIEPGSRYEVLYERLPTEPVEQRDVELALFTMVLAARDAGVLAHGCGYVMPNGRAVLSPGMSGAGKSTLGRLMSRWGDTPVLNDDRIVITRDGSGFRAWGSPWPGQGGMANALDAPLTAIAFIRQAPRCAIADVTPRDAARRLYRMLALPLWSGAATAGALELVDQLVTTLPLLELAYPATPEAAHWIVSTLLGRTTNE